MVHLCSNRPDGFGPMSPVSPHTLTTCFLDTILIPFCTWLYLLALVLAVTAAFRIKRQSTGNLGLRDGNRLDKEAIPAEGAEGNAPQTPTAAYTGRRKWLHVIGQILYYFLLFAVAALTALEVARLSKAGLGVGLLPFIFVTLLIATVLHLSNGGRNTISHWRWLNASVFILLCIIYIVKIAEEWKGRAIWDMARDDRRSSLEQARHIRNGPRGRGKEGSEYIVEDEVTDMAAMVAVYIILAILETVLKPRRSQEPAIS